MRKISRFFNSGPGKSGFLVLTALLMLLSGCSSDKNTGKQLPIEQLNILFLTADDLDCNSIGAFGCNVKDITPNIDKLASEGVMFTNAHTNTAVCQPCRQSMLTGLYPHNHGGEGLEPINEDITTLTELLKKAGYVNGILGKEVHHQPTEKFYWDYIPHRDTDSIWRKGHSRTPSLFYEYSKRFFELAKEQGKPFFFQANSHDPHRPFTGSLSDKRIWGDNPPPTVNKYSEDDIEMLGYLPDIPDVRKEVTQYYNTVVRCDQNIGAVLKAFKESGFEDNTMVIFLSDHGAAFPFSKSQCYFNSTKTPLIIKLPGVTEDGPDKIESLISSLDIMPTIMEAAGISFPEGLELDGRSFTSLLLNQEYEERDYVFTSYYQIFARIRYPMRALQNKEFGYIYNFWSDGDLRMRGDATGGLTWRAMKKAAETDPEIAKRVELYKHRVKEEFYDFKNDPDALVNLADDPAYADELNKFREKMLEYMKKYDDPSYAVYRDRNQEGIVEKFMVEQQEKAKHTKENIHF